MADALKVVGRGPHTRAQAALARPPVHDGMWKGGRCWVIGGGGSLKDFDWERLRGELVIAVNRAWEPLWRIGIVPPIVFSMDNRFWKWSLESWQHVPGYTEHEARVLSQIDSAKIWNNVAIQQKGHPFKRHDVINVPCLGKEFWGTSLDTGLGGGGNSGFGALNLACILGADPVYLLGFDMHGEDGRAAHFHGGYPDRSQRSHIYRNKFLPTFLKHAEAIKSRHRVVNLYRGSALRCFEFGDVEDVPTRSPESTPVFLAYWTTGTGYGDLVPRLRRSMVRHGLEYEITEVPNLGSWQRNTQHKAVVIRDAMGRYPGRPVVYVDIDAEITRYPAEFFRPSFIDAHDFAVHWRKGRGMAELLSGTLWLRNNSASRALVAAWIEENRRCPDVFDQRNLAKVWEKWRSRGRWVDLPADYCAIFDKGMSTDPVILHHQASRTLKNTIR